jgi:hypothetical protein
MLGHLETMRIEFAALQQDRDKLVNEVSVLKKVREKLR